MAEAYKCDFCPNLYIKETKTIFTLLDGKFKGTRVNVSIRKGYDGEDSDLCESCLLKALREVLKIQSEYKDKKNE